MAGCETVVCCVETYGGLRNFYNAAAQLCEPLANCDLPNACGAGVAQADCSWDPSENKCYDTVQAMTDSVGRPVVTPAPTPAPTQAPPAATPSSSSSDSSTDCSGGQNADCGDSSGPDCSGNGTPDPQDPTNCICDDGWRTNRLAGGPQCAIAVNIQGSVISEAIASNETVVKDNTTLIQHLSSASKLPRPVDMTDPEVMLTPPVLLGVAVLLCMLWLVCRYMASGGCGCRRKQPEQMPFGMYNGAYPYGQPPPYGAQPPAVLQQQQQPPQWTAPQQAPTMQQAPQLPATFPGAGCQQPPPAPMTPQTWQQQQQQCQQQHQQQHQQQYQQQYQPQYQQQYQQQQQQQQHQQVPASWQDHSTPAPLTYGSPRAAQPPWQTPSPQPPPADHSAWQSNMPHFQQPYQSAAVEAASYEQTPRGMYQQPAGPPLTSSPAHQLQPHQQAHGPEQMRYQEPAPHRSYPQAYSNGLAPSWQDEQRPPRQPQYLQASPRHYQQPHFDDYTEQYNEPLSPRTAGRHRSPPAAARSQEPATTSPPRQGGRKHHRYRSHSPPREPQRHYEAGRSHPAPRQRPQQIQQQQQQQQPVKQRVQPRRGNQPADLPSESSLADGTEEWDTSESQFRTTTEASQSELSLFSEAPSSVQEETVSRSPPAEAGRRGGRPRKELPNLLPQREHGLRDDFSDLSSGKKRPIAAGLPPYQTGRKPRHHTPQREQPDSPRLSPRAIGRRV
eukprot:TRINITY_DN867_c0_g2_i1.p1 TRINITY_DN867_c0_g2~~TRINITY_DN867_c0_g2_i1.p1  ORF type:complete len:726 (-),score=113.99 TRINITY_DN867_c0_g2_i1:158-2335(-)